MLNGGASLAEQHPQLVSCQRHAVEVEDTAEANLLSALPAAVAFITAALQPGGSGRVLVHCAQGVSRSAAVAAAYLMAASAGAAGGAGGLDPEAALGTLRRACPAAAPNDGFMAQLQLFHAMGCCLDEAYVPYKRFLLQQASRGPARAACHAPCRRFGRCPAQACGSKPARPACIHRPAASHKGCPEQRAPWLAVAAWQLAVCQQRPLPSVKGLAGHERVGHPRSLPTA